jgi:hypothetical protein
MYVVSDGIRNVICVTMRFPTWCICMFDIGSLFLASILSGKHRFPLQVARYRINVAESPGRWHLRHSSGGTYQTIIVR